MWFKNLSLYRLPADFVLPSNLESQLAEHALRSPGLDEVLMFVD